MKINKESSFGLDFSDSNSGSGYFIKVFHVDKTKIDIILDLVENLSDKMNVNKKDYKL